MAPQECWGPQVSKAGSVPNSSQVGEQGNHSKAAPSSHRAGQNPGFRRRVSQQALECLLCARRWVASCKATKTVKTFFMGAESWSVTRKVNIEDVR